MESKRHRVWWAIEDQDPYLLIGSPPCDPFSNLHNPSIGREDPTKRAEKIRRGIIHLSFCFALYRHRAANGRYFLHEHPWSAWSWKLDFIQDFMQRTDVYLGRGDQCPCGQWSTDEHGEGLVSQLKSDKVLKDGFIGVLGPEEEFHEGLATDCWNQLGVALQVGGSAASTTAPEEGIYIDDVSGCILDPKLVRQARLEELQEIHSFKCYQKVPISERIQVTGKKPIGCRWSDTYKGDEKAPKYRSRLCAKEFRASDPLKDGCFAATPPLEALRLLLSMCMGEWDNDVDREHSKRGKWKLLFMDATRCHFHSPVREAIYVDLCPEEAESGYCMKLFKSMYGTRQAASNWEYFYAEVLKDAGFVSGVSNPCLFIHPESRIRVWVHGGDFVGVHEDLMWAEKTVNARIKMKCTGLLGPDPGDDKEVSCLN